METTTMWCILVAVPGRLFLPDDLIVFCGSELTTDNKPISTCLPEAMYKCYHNKPSILAYLIEDCSKIRMKCERFKEFKALVDCKQS